MLKKKKKQSKEELKINSPKKGNQTPERKKDKLETNQDVSNRLRSGERDPGDIINDNKAFSIYSSPKMKKSKLI